MATLIQEIAKLLKMPHGISLDIEFHETELLVTLAITAQRKQAVLVTTQSLPNRLGFTVQFRSRACIAHNHSVVRQAAIANVELELGGLALDTSTNPPCIDVVYRLDSDRIDFQHFMICLQRIAHQADFIERQYSRGDRF